jgi:Phage integrase family
MKFLHTYVELEVAKQVEQVSPDTSLCWSTWGQRFGYPELKPHDLRQGVAMEVLEQHHDLERVRALLGHACMGTTQFYASIRPPQLKRAMAFYEAERFRKLTAQAARMLSTRGRAPVPGSRNI